MHQVAVSDGLLTAFDAAFYIDHTERITVPNTPGHALWHFGDPTERPVVTAVMVRRAEVLVPIRWRFDARAHMLHIDDELLPDDVVTISWGET